MNKIYTTLVALAATVQCAYAQNTFGTTGNASLYTLPAANVTLYNAGSITGGISAYGLFTSKIIQPDVTTSAIVYGSSVTTAPSAAVANIFHYSAGQAVLGAGSSVATQIGFVAQSNLIGASNNWGFRGNIPAGTGRWNLYMDGTAQNYISGNLGLGINAPSARLHIFNSTAAAWGTASPAAVITGSVTDNSTAAGATVGGVTAALLTLGSTSLAATNAATTGITYTNAASMYITGAPTGGTNVTITNPYALYVNSGANYFGGNVGIGTVNTFGGFKLSVNGSIRSKEVKVETGWSDYVFDQAYQLRPITEVEKYIKLHHHLPEVPSAAEVEKNGILIGETSSLLLKKIEELTLYLIEKDKQLVDQQKAIQSLQEQMNSLLKKK